MTDPRFFKTASFWSMALLLVGNFSCAAELSPQSSQGTERRAGGQLQFQAPSQAQPQGIGEGVPSGGTTAGAPGPLSPNPASATYFIQGHAVSAQKYQAALLASEGLSLMRSNLNEAAADKLKQAVTLAPDLPEAHHNLGLVLAKLGDVPGAIAEINRAIALKGDLDSSWLTLGGLHQSAGHIQEAIDTYKQFLNKFPNHPMHKKIGDLVSGLTNENRTMAAARQATEALQPAVSAGSGQQPSLTQAADQSDYVAEVTRAGVFRWPAARMPLKVYVHPGVKIDPASGKPSGFRDEFRDVLLRSFDDWSKASNGLVKFIFVDNPHDATMECFWVSNPSALKNPAEAGEAQVYTNQDGIASGTIRLLTQSMSPVLPLTNNRMRVICLHEIGHALGLAGHTANPDDIMFYSVSFKDQWKELSGRDARTIKRLYSGN